MSMKTIRIALFIALFFAFSAAAAASHLVNLSICDTLGGTALVQNKVTLCYDDADPDVIPDDIYKVLDSTQSLAKTNAKPFTDTVHPPSITFLYDEPAPGAKKAVRAIATYNVNAKPQFPLGSFSLNFVYGQGLVLILDQEYYVLLNSTVMDLFTFEKTKLTHIPTGTVFAPQSVQGTNWYTFQTLGQKKIAAGVFGAEVGAEVLISPLEQGEVPAAYVKPYNLTQQYEIQFTFATPINVTDPSLVGQLAICQADNKADIQQVLVCRNNVEQFTLKKNVLTTRTLDGKDYAFLYDYVGNEKRVSVFTIQDISRSVLALGQTHSLWYNDFINSVIAGRRLVIKFNDQLYVLQHPVSPVFSLLNLKLVAHEEAGTTNLNAAGSEDLVEFTGLKGEKIFLQRNYGTPPPPFQLSGRSVEELEPANLEGQLFTSLSSTGAVTIVNLFGKITAAPDDTKLYQPTFKIFSVGKNQAYTLPYRQPLVVNGSTLFYYHTAEISGVTPIKTTSIYQFYDLTSGAKERPFNDVFIANITRGKELALRYGSSYYLLGHKGNPGAVKFYDPAQLTLRYINGTESFPVSVEGEEAHFTILDGRIDVKVDIGAGKVSFKALSSKDLVATVEFVEYMTELTPSNRVKVGSSILRLCFQNVYASLPSAKVCDDNKNVTDIIVDPVAGATPVLTIGNNRYVLESNGQTGDTKKVFIRSLLELKKGDILDILPSDPNMPISWTKFSGDVAAKKHPIFNISGMLYLPLAQGSKLEVLSFAPFPAGTPQYTVKNLQQVTPISFNGTFVLHDTILVVRQQETQVEAMPLTVSFAAAAYSYLPENGAPLSLNSSYAAELSFVTQFNQVPYTLKVNAVSGNLARLSLRMGNDFLFSRWFAKDEVRELTLAGVRFEIKVQSVDKDKGTATVTVRRLL